MINISIEPYPEADQEFARIVPGPLRQYQCAVRRMILPRYRTIPVALEHCLSGVRRPPVVPGTSHCAFVSRAIGSPLICVSALESIGKHKARCSRFGGNDTGDQ